MANPRLVNASGERVEPYQRAGRDPRRLDERQRVGMLRRRHAVDRPRARFRSDVDGPGAAGAVRPLPNGDVLIHA